MLILYVDFGLIARLFSVVSCLVGSFDCLSCLLVSEVYVCGSELERFMLQADCCLGCLVRVGGWQAGGEDLNVETKLFGNVNMRHYTQFTWLDAWCLVL